MIEASQQGWANERLIPAEVRHSPNSTTG